MSYGFTGDKYSCTNCGSYVSWQLVSDVVTKCPICGTCEEILPNGKVKRYKERPSPIDGPNKPAYQSVNADIDKLFQIK